MKSKLTDFGPWYLDGKKTGIIGYEKHRDGGWCAPDYIAHVCKYDWSWPGRAEANARLIAAAPVLFDLVSELLAAGEGKWEKKDRALISCARAWIASVEGEK